MAKELSKAINKVATNRLDGIGIICSIAVARIGGSCFIEKVYDRDNQEQYHCRDHRDGAQLLGPGGIAAALRY